MQTAPEISFPDIGISDIALDYQVDVNQLTGVVVVSFPLSLKPGQSRFGLQPFLQFSKGYENSPLIQSWKFSIQMFTAIHNLKQTNGTGMVIIPPSTPIDRNMHDLKMNGFC